MPRKIVTEYKLVSFDVCPFVQRSIITLEEKQVPYDIEYIELGDPPDWFMAASPLGKVVPTKNPIHSGRDSGRRMRFLVGTTSAGSWPEATSRRTHSTTSQGYGVKASLSVVSSVINFR